MSGLEAVNRAQGLATATGYPWLVVMSGDSLIVIRIGAYRTGFVIERCNP